MRGCCRCCCCYYSLCCCDYHCCCCWWCWWWWWWWWCRPSNRRIFRRSARKASLIAWDIAAAWSPLLEHCRCGRLFFHSRRCTTTDAAEYILFLFNLLDVMTCAGGFRVETCHCCIFFLLVGSADADDACSLASRFSPSASRPSVSGYGGEDLACMAGARGKGCDVYRWL